MIELFKGIIIGEVSISALDENVMPDNTKSKRKTEVAKLFLNAARGKYNTGEIDRNDFNALFVEYNKLIKVEENIKNYIDSNLKNDATLGLINHIIVIFMDKFVENKEVLRTPSFQKKLTRKIATKGYVEPLLLSLVVIGTSFLFLANLYLNI